MSKQLHDTRRKIFKFHKIISEVLSIFVGNFFFGQQERNNGYFWREEKLRIDRKIEWVVLKQRNEIKSYIKPISYGCSMERATCSRNGNFHKKQGLNIYCNNDLLYVL